MSALEVQARALLAERMMQRDYFHHGDLRLSYLDSGGKGPLLIALHAHWMEAETFRRLAAHLRPGWRTVALDQRGHGHSDHARSYTRDDYLGDLLALYEHLRVEQAVLLGNSLGGANAYQFAARHPERVRALVIEEIGAVIDDDMGFVREWAGAWPTREALAQRIGERLLPYLEPSFRHEAEGWRLAFDPEDMIASQAALNGNHWDDWLASHCPALLLRGRESRLSKPELFEQMAQRRPNTTLLTLAGGHVLHIDNPMGFADAVRGFLAELPDLREG